jgi:hypothetical protein
MIITFLSRLNNDLRCAFLPFLYIPLCTIITAPPWILEVYSHSTSRTTLLTSRTDGVTVNPWHQDAQGQVYIFIVERKRVLAYLLTCFSNIP